MPLGYFAAIIKYPAAFGLHIDSRWIDSQRGFNAADRGTVDFFKGAGFRGDVVCFFSPAAILSKSPEGHGEPKRISFRD
jgi:hypothetical protein